jgi:GTP-binding protein Era
MTQFALVSKRFLRKVPVSRLPVPNFEKRLDVVILGHVNTGKSVLLNTLIDEKVAATSRKRHTTRYEILGVFNHRNVQLAFYDTPGYMRYDKHMSEDIKTLRDTAESSASKADVVLLVVDASLPLTDSYKDAFSEMAKLAIQSAKMEIILILNKVDLVNPKNQLLSTTYQLVSLINGVKLGPEKAHLAKLDTTTFMISALQDDGVIDIKNYLISLATTKPWIIPKEKGKTSLSKAQRVEQVILEMLLDNTHQEIPYIAAIRCKKISNLTHFRVRIDVDIEVENPTQKKIVIGYQGRNLVKIRQSSVEVLEQILSTKVILYLWIKAKSGDETNETNEIEDFV